MAITTTEDREINPKAVFMGSIGKIINPLANYLTRHNVELFSGNTASDAAYGNYFFYVGDDSSVNEIIAITGKQLPKSLFLITSVSDVFKESELLSQNPNFKIVYLNSQIDFNDELAEKIIGFFLGSSDKVYKIAEPERKTGDKEIKIPKIAIPEPQKDMSRWQIDITAQKNVISKEDEQSFQRLSLKEQVFSKPTGGQVKGFSLNNKMFWISLLVLLILVLFPVGVLGMEISLGAFQLYRANQQVSKSDLTGAKNSFVSSSYFFDIARQNIINSSGIYKLFGLNEFGQGIEHVAELGKHLSSGGGYLTSSARESQVLFNSISGTEQDDSLASSLSSIKGNLTLASTEFSLAEAVLRTQNVNAVFKQFSWFFTDERIKRLNLKTQDTRGMINAANDSLTLLPEIVGLYGKRTYLIIFQNNMEMRPTGGFIGSYGLASFEDGTLKSFTVEDVYTADGALKGHVDPPAAIKTYLEQEHWYMRDSNWDPDFPRSAARIAWFLEKELDVKTDGVIAVDLDFVKNLLDVVGPLDVPDYNEKITADNLFIKSHEFAQTDFFPGSTQKKDFLGALGRSLLARLMEGKNINQVGLLKKVSESLNNKSMMLSFTNCAFEDLARRYGWAGDLNFSGASDGLAVIDANLGVNKANYFVTRNTEDKVTITNDFRVRHELKISWKNDSPTDSSDVGGEYKNYLRVYVPAGYELKSANSNMLPLNLTKDKLASSSSVTSGVENGHQVFAHFIKVKPKEQKTLTLVYERSLGSLAGLDAYTYLIFKQPGMENENLLVKIGQITYNSKLTKDQLIEVPFSR